MVVFVIAYFGRVRVVSCMALRAWRGIWKGYCLYGLACWSILSYLGSYAYTHDVTLYK